jgi:hypothetical protein
MASGVVKRDARHDHSLDGAPRHRSRKDTKRWCRGKVGVEHGSEVVKERFRTITRCPECHKHLDVEGLWQLGR